MPRKTRFSELWLLKKMEDGELVSTWCQGCKDDPYSAHCRICDKRFSVSNMGFGQLLSHSKSKKHLSSMKCASNQSFFSLQKKDNEDNSTSSTQCSSMLQLTGSTKKLWVPASLTEKVLKAEAVILLTAIKCNYSFSSINDLAQVMPIAFEDSAIAKHIKLSDAKARYLTKFGIAPYLRQKIFSDVDESEAFFTLHFDESTTKQVKKQMDIYIAYWSERHGKVVAFYCDSFFLGHADAERILELILKFISDSGLRLSRLLQCSIDGPNVNLSFQKKLNAHLALQNLENLIDIGTCSLHVVHNALRKGIAGLDCDVERFVSDIYQWFKMSAARREDFRSIQVSSLVESAENHLFLRHVDSRWCTLGPVCERIVEQYEALQEYFLKFLPKANVKPGERYNNICAFLKESKNLMFIHFTIFICNAFTPYLKLFQKESPLIHILYVKQNELLRNVMFKFIKDESVGLKEGISLCNVNCQDSNNWMLLKKIDIGCAAKKLLSIPQHRDFLLCVRSTYIKICEYLQKKLPLSNPLLRDLKYISPDCQSDPSKSKEAIARIADHMIKVTKTDVICDCIKSEYSVYIHDDLTAEKALYLKENDICHYWAEVAKKKDVLGKKKYPNLCKLMKSCLTLSHGNSIPERGFSINNNIVTEERFSLSEIGIKSLRICKDFLKKQDSVSKLISKELINQMQKARAEYASYLEQIKADKEKDNRKRKIEEENEVLRKRAKENLTEMCDQLSNKENELLKEQEVSHSLLDDANKKLIDAVKNNDFASVKVAQMMLDTANTNLKSLDAQLSVVRCDVANMKKKVIIL